MDAKRADTPPPSLLGNPIIQTLAAIFAAWFVLRLALDRFEPLFWGALLFSLWTAWVLWSLRYDRLRLAMVRQNGAGRALVDLVCRMAREQTPVEGPLPGVVTTAEADSDLTRAPKILAGGSPSPEVSKDASNLRLRKAEDYRAALKRSQHAVRGHDEAIRLLFEAIRRALELRAGSRPGEVKTPLGIFALSGPEGVGKRHLACVIAGEIYGAGAAVGVDCGAEDDAAAVAIAAFRARPESVLVVESIERATPRFLEFLEVVASSGGVIDPSTQKPVSFRRGFIFLLTAKGATDSPAGGAGFTVMAKTVGREIGLSPRLSHLVTEYLTLAAPEPIAIAEALVLMMEAECERYGMKLGQVAPEILAKEVEILGDGFAVAPARVAKLLRRPILDAKSASRQEVVVPA